MTLRQPRFREQVAAVHAVTEEQGTQILFAARLQVEDREITEIETMVARGASEAMLFNLDNLQEPSEVFLTPPPADKRMPREDVVDMAMRYPEGLRVGSFVTSGADFSEDAYRFENGQLMAGPACSAFPVAMTSRTRDYPSCPAYPATSRPFDEENGTVLSAATSGPVLMAAAVAGHAVARVQGKRLRRRSWSRSKPKIYGGEIHAVEAVFESMPANSPTDWD